MCVQFHFLYKELHNNNIHVSFFQYTQWPQEEVKMLGTFGAGADSTSFAQLNWLTDKSGYCFIYKVVVIGQDNQGQSVSIYRTYKLKADDGCKARPTTKDIVEALIEENNVCLATAPNVQSQANQISTEVQRAQNVSDLASETSSNRNKLENANNLILAFQPTLEALSNNQDEITRQSETIDSLNSSLIDGYASKFQEIENMLKKIDVHEKATTVLESVPATSVSSIYEDAVYIIRQQTGSMDLSSMAADCSGLNGILLEFEGWYEQQFVGSFLNLKNLEPAFTGANDVVEEGRYVYYQSGNPVGSVVWNSDEPDNSTTENCVGLFQSGKLSDLSCDTNAKFICKISLIQI